MKNPSTSAYFDAIRDAEGALADALSHVRAEEDSHHITAVEAATERIDLLERHLAECRRLRRELLGGSLG